MSQALDRHGPDVRAEMFFGEVPTFEEILRVVGEFERLFSKSGGRAANPTGRRRKGAFPSGDRRGVRKRVGLDPPGPVR
jgi:hypothetical protein